MRIFYKIIRVTDIGRKVIRALDTITLPVFDSISIVGLVVIAMILGAALFEVFVELMFMVVV
jgi:hypothetical protein